MMRPAGWRYESARHALAARGIATGRKGYFAAGYWPKGPSKIRTEEEEEMLRKEAAALEAAESGGIPEPAPGAGLELTKKERRMKLIATPKVSEFERQPTPMERIFTDEARLEAKKAGIGIFLEGMQLAPRNDIERLFVESTENPFDAAMMILRYRDLDVDPNVKPGQRQNPMKRGEGAFFNQKIMQIRKLQEDLDEVPAYEKSLRAALKRELAEKRGELVSGLGLSGELVVNKYAGDVEKSILQDLARKRSRGMALNTAEQEILEAAERGAQWKPEIMLQKKYLEPRPQDVEIFSLIDKNVAARNIKPQYAQLLKKELKGTEWPRGIVAGEPGYKGIYEQVAAGEMTVPEAIRAKQEYTKQLKLLGQTKMQRAKFSGPEPLFKTYPEYRKLLPDEVMLPFGKTERPRLSEQLKKGSVGKEYVDLEWFARKKHSKGMMQQYDTSWVSGKKGVKEDNRAYVADLKKRGYDGRIFVDTKTKRVLAGVGKKGLSTRLIDMNMVERSQYLARKPWFVV